MGSDTAWFFAALGVFGYVLIVYPAVIACFGLRARTRQVAESILPTVSVIIAAYNEEQVIEGKLENSLSLDYPTDRLETILASDGSADRTVEIARRFESRGVRVMEFPRNRGKASVVNDAVEAARGEVICLSDANVMFRRDALAKLVGRLAGERIGAVSGDVRLASDESNFGEGESVYYRLERAVQLGESRIGSMMGVDGGMYVLRKELYQPLPADTILDDFVISMQVIQQGYRVVYEPTAIAHENGTPLARQEFRRRVRVMEGAVQSIKRGQWPPLRRPVELWQYVSHKLLRWLGPVLLLVLLVSSGALWNTGSVYRVTFLAQLGFYALAAVATVSVRFRKTWLGGIAFYFAMSHVAMAIGLLRGVFLRQKGTWKRTERTGVKSVENSDLELTSEAS